MRVNNSNLRSLMFSAILGIFSVTVAHAGTCQPTECYNRSDCDSACGHCDGADPAGKGQKGTCQGDSGLPSQAKSSARK